MKNNIFRVGLVFIIVLLTVTQVFISPMGAQPIPEQDLRGESITSQDDVPPEISDITYPYIVTVPAFITISAIVTDDVAVESVKLNIQFPSYTFNLTMINTPSTNEYYLDIYLFLEAEYDFLIWASDTSGNTNSSTIYTIDGQLSGSPPDVGFLGEVTLTWKWKVFIPGVGESDFYHKPNMTIDVNCTNGEGIIDEISFGYNVFFDLGPYFLPRLSYFQLACYYNEKCTQLVKNGAQHWSFRANDDFHQKYLSLKNVSIFCEGLNNRTIYCKISVAPRLVFMFIPWLKIRDDRIVLILVNFNYQ